MALTFPLQTNDAIVAATNGSDVASGLLSWYKAGGATSNDLQDAERQFLNAAYPAGGDQANQDLWNGFLQSLGYADAYVGGKTLRLTGGMGGGSAYFPKSNSSDSQYRAISGYVVGSKIATVSPRWATNRLPYSDDFSNAYWLKVGNVYTVTPNVGIAPDGTLTADLCVPSAINGYIIGYVSGAIAGLPVGVSVYAKSQSTSYSLRVGVVKEGDTEVGVSINAVINPTTWTRISVSGIANSGSAQHGIIIQNLVNAEGVYLWRARLEPFLDDTFTDLKNTDAFESVAPDNSTSYEVLSTVAPDEASSEALSSNVPVESRNIAAAGTQNTLTLRGQVFTSSLDDKLNAYWNNQFVAPPAVEFHLNFTAGTAEPLIDTLLLAPFDMVETSAVVSALFVRDSEASIVQADGTYAWARPQELRFPRMRRIENLQRYSDNLTPNNYDWQVTGGAFVINSNTLSLPHNQSYLRGVTVAGISGSPGKTYILSAYLSAATPADVGKQVRMLIVDTITNSETILTVTLTGVQTRYSVARLSAAGAGGVFIQFDTRNFVEVTAVIHDVQFEQVASGITAPSAYVSRDVRPGPYFHGCFVDGVKYFPDALGLNIDGILMEKTSTNLLLRSSEFDNSAWNVFPAGNTVVTPNTDVAPDLSVTGDSIFFPLEGYKYQLITLSSDIESRTFTFSIWLKSNTVSSTVLRIASSTNNGAIGVDSKANTISITPTWARYFLTHTFIGSSVELSVGIDIRPAVGGINQTGDIVAWGGQLEEAFGGSSYVRTGAASVTRFGEQLRYVEQSVVDYDQLSLIAEFIPDGSVSGYSNQVALSLYDNSRSDSVDLACPCSGISNPGATILVNNAMFFDDTPMSNVTTRLNAINRVGITMKSGDQQAAANGVLGSSGSVHVSPPPRWSYMYIWGFPAAAAQNSISCKVRKIFVTRLWQTDAELMVSTQVT